MVIWQDKYLCDSILAQTDKKKLKSSTKYWVDMLLKYYIYNLSVDKDIKGIKETFDNNIKDIKVKAAVYLDVKADSEMIDEAIEKIDICINELTDAKRDKTFFNDKSITVYKSEIETIEKVGKEFNYNSKNGKHDSVILQKYLFVYLVHQKAMQNRCTNNKTWVFDNEEKLRDYTESKGDSSHRTKRFKKLIDAGYLKYKIEPPLNIRKNYPKLLYQVPCIKTEGDDVAFEINDFRYIWEHYLVYKYPKSKFCVKCGEYFVAKHKDCNNCKKCNR